MTDNMKKILEAASKDAELMKKLDGTKDPAEFIAAAKEMGFTLTEEDLKSGTAKKGELNDDELDTIAGGIIDFALGVGFTGKGSFADQNGFGIGACGCGT